GCGRPAVATLTYAYSEQTAVVGPLVEEEDPHSWDLCSHHADKITAPQGWELVRVDHIELEADEDLLALAEAVREAGRVTTGLSEADQTAGAFQRATMTSSTQLADAFTEGVTSQGLAVIQSGRSAIDQL